jgi:NAD(P)-dependent dehydrogenase (short-subunit alcohol dehydrogenase family)
MDLQLRDKVVLITGGAKGIGAAITKSLAQEGAIAIGVDRDAAACQQLQGELGAQGLTTQFISLIFRHPKTVGRRWSKRSWHSAGLMPW